MITRIDDGLYLSAAEDARDLASANPLGIKTIVNVAASADQPVVGAVNIHLPMEDGNISPESFDAAIAAISGHIGQGKVLVHCMMGTSRSAALVAAYLAITKGWTLNTALAKVKKLRPEVDPGDGTLESARRYLAQRAARLRKHSVKTN
jgi:protein-tyrosine phosphatase